MKMLGAAAIAATLLSSTALAPLASAADLPVAPEPVDYVRVCDAYGKGFLYIPGTDTCLRLRGRNRADYNVYVAPDDEVGIFDDQGFDDSEDRGYRFRARSNIYYDSRTATEFGLLRTFFELELTLNSLSQGSGDLELDLSLENGYIEFGGLTFGVKNSFFDFGDVAFSAAQTFDPAYSDAPLPLIAYTRSFGPVDATIALEDNTSRRYEIAGGRYGGAQIPDVVGQLRWENEDIGAVQLMAAGHYVNAIGEFERNNGNTFERGDETYGFAVGGGVTLNMPIGNDTKVGVLGTFARGANAYLSVDIESPLGVADAAVGSRDRDVELSDGFAISGGFETSFTDRIAFAFNVGYLEVDAPDAASDEDEDGRRDDLDVSNLDLQAYLSYEPADDFELGVGTEYRLVDADDVGEGSILTTFVRAQRAF